MTNDEIGLRIGNERRKDLDRNSMNKNSRIRNGSNIVRRERRGSKSTRDSTRRNIKNEPLRKRRSDDTICDIVHINSEGNVLMNDKGIERRRKVDSSKENTMIHLHFTQYTSRTLTI